MFTYLTFSLLVVTALYALFLLYYLPRYKGMGGVSRAWKTLKEFGVYEIQMPTKKSKEKPMPGQTEQLNCFKYWVRKGKAEIYEIAEEKRGYVRIIFKLI